MLCVVEFRTDSGRVAGVSPSHDRVIRTPASGRPHPAQLGWEQAAVLHAATTGAEVPPPGLRSVLCPSPLHPPRAFLRTATPVATSPPTIAVSGGHAREVSGPRGWPRGVVGKTPPLDDPGASLCPHPRVHWKWPDDTPSLITGTSKLRPTSPQPLIRCHSGHPQVQASGLSLIHI